MISLYLGVLCLNERDVQSKIPANPGFFIIWREEFMTSENTEQVLQPIKKPLPPNAGKERVKGVELFPLFKPYTVE